MGESDMSALLGLLKARLEAATEGVSWRCQSAQQFGLRYGFFIISSVWYEGNEYSMSFSLNMGTFGVGDIPELVHQARSERFNFRD